MINNTVQNLGILILHMLLMGTKFGRFYAITARNTLSVIRRNPLLAQYFVFLKAEHMYTKQTSVSSLVLVKKHITIIDVTWLLKVISETRVII